MEKVELEDIIEESVENQLREIKGKSINDLERDGKTWNCCNSKLDHNAVRFFSVLGISVLGVSFCISKLFTDDQCSNHSTYMTIMTGIISYWMPSPNLS